jgi:hypothetical protein
MTSVTVRRRAPRLVAIHTVFHGRGNFFCDDFTLRNRPVAMGAINARFAMPRVAEEDKIRDSVNLAGWKRRGLVPQRRQPLDLPAVLLHRAMARHALAHRRERCLLPGLNRRVAILAFDLQRRMPLVAEVDRLFGARRPGYGKENATSESE